MKKDSPGLNIDPNSRPVDVPAFTCVVYVSKTERGETRARVANLDGIDFIAATERDALTKIVPAFKDTLQSASQKTGPFHGSIRQLRWVATNKNACCRFTCRASLTRPKVDICLETAVTGRYAADIGTQKHQRITMKLCTSMLTALIAICFFSIATESFVSGEGTLIGRWDLTVSGADGSYPSWLEVKNQATQPSWDLTLGNSAARDRLPKCKQPTTFSVSQFRPNGKNEKSPLRTNSNSTVKR